MTVSTLTRRVTYTGDGTNATLAVPFQFFAETDLVVTRKLIASPYTETGMALTTDYTVTGGSGATGSVQVVDGATDFTAAYTWTISRTTALTQPADYPVNDPFPAETHEDALDRLTLIAQDARDDADRALHLPDTDADGISTELPGKDDRASQYLGFDAAGEPIALAAPAGTTAVTPFMATVLDDNTAGDARATLDAQEDVIAAQGDIVRGDGLGIAEALPLAGADQPLGSDGTTVVYLGFPYGPRNLLRNGDFRVAQRGTAFTAASTPANSDDTYLLDGWILLSDGNDVVDVSQNTTVKPTGAYSSLKALVATANKKFGFFQVIEARDSAKLIAGVASLSFQARTSVSGIANLRAAIIQWSGTADSVTSDIVSAWNAAGADPTWIANVTAANTPSNLALSNQAWTRYEIQGVSIASGNNLGVFVWVDDADAALNNDLFLGDLQLELGAVATPFSRRGFEDELRHCQRFYQRYGGVSGAFPMLQASNVISGQVPAACHPFVPPMRIAPTVTKAGTWTSTNCGQPTFTAPDRFGFVHKATGDSSGTQLTSQPVDATTYVEFTAEL